MSDWQPGIPVYVDPREADEDEPATIVRSILSVITDPLYLTPRKAACWPDPYPSHDLDAQEGPL